LRVLANEREAAYTQRQRDTALAAIRLTSIWDMPTTQANQFLRKLFGNRRIVCNEGDVTGLRVIG
jgi:hypothetical protein